MLYKLETKSVYSRYFGNEIFKQKEDYKQAWLSKSVAEIEFERHIGRHSVYNAKLYKLSWRGYKLIKEYDRDKRNNKEHSRVDVNTLLRDADRRSARGL